MDRQRESHPGDAANRRSLRSALTFTLPQHYNRWVQVIFYAGLLYAVFGFYNQNYLFWIRSPWFSTYSERIAIVIFGVVRVLSEKDRYTRRRLVVLVGAVSLFWLALPLGFGIDFFNHHLFGTPWFFIYLVIIFFIGRRADCSWNCPCVGLRDTAGEPFRERTLKGRSLYALQSIKWLALASSLPALWITLVDRGAAWGPAYMLGFWTVHLNLYFASLLLVPLTGNRNYCRFLCPWGAMYGLVGRLGFFRVAVDRELCVPCNQCERACDMGLPLRALIAAHGEIKVSDCVGCGRCVQACPRQAMRLEDVRSLWQRRGSRKESDSSA